MNNSNIFMFGCPGLQKLRTLAWVPGFGHILNLAGLLAHSTHANKNGVRLRFIYPSPKVPNAIIAVENSFDSGIICLHGIEICIEIYCYMELFICMRLFACLFVWKITQCSEQLI